MFARFKEQQARGGSNLSLCLILFTVLWGGLMLIPTTISLRDQRIENAAYALFMVTAFYIGKKVSKTIGAVLLYIGFISVYSFIYSIEIFASIYALVILFLFISYTYHEWHDRKNTIYDALCVIVFVNVAFQVMQYFGIYFISYPIAGTEKFHCGLMNNVNDLSVLYAVCVPAFFRKNRWYYIAIPLLGLYMCLTLTGIIVTGTLIIIAMTVLTRNPRVTFLVLVICYALVTFYAINVENFSLSSQKAGRAYIWEQAVKVASVKKTGWGLNQFDKVMPLITSFEYIDPQTRQYLYAQVFDKTNFDKALQKMSGNDMSYFADKTRQSPTYFLQAHNEYIELFFIGGFILLILSLIAIVRYLYLGFKQKDKIPFYGLLASCGSAFLFFGWHIVPIALITVLYMGMIRGEYRRGEK